MKSGRRATESIVVRFGAFKKGLSGKTQRLLTDVHANTNVVLT